MPKPPAKKPAPTKAEPTTRTLDEIDASRGPKRVKALRDKFEKVLEDPDTREAMARYLQQLLREGKS